MTTRHKVLGPPKGTAPVTHISGDEFPCFLVSIVSRLCVPKTIMLLAACQAHAALAKRGSL